MGVDVCVLKIGLTIVRTICYQLLALQDDKLSIIVC